MTSGAASGAGSAARAAASASATSSRTASAPVTVRPTTPALVPPAEPLVAMTVTDRDDISPLVVKELLAQRRLASERSVTMTTVPSVVAAASAASTMSWGESRRAISVLPPAPC